MGMTSPLCRRSAAADVRIMGGPLSVEAALKSVRSAERGGVALFLGDVRGAEDGAPIAAIRYEAYEEMALAEMARIVREAEERWDAAVSVQHRVGRVPAGETAIVVAAAAAHRAEAFAACRYVTDAVKSQVPLWKISFESVRHSGEDRNPGVASEPQKPLTPSLRAGDDKAKLRCGVLTVSDRASRGEYADETGPRVAALIETRGWSVAETAVLPDDADRLRVQVRAWADQGLDLVIAAGGTGIGPRDVTPEALRPLLDKELPGFGELMRAEGLKHTKKAALSRSFAGARGRTLVLAVPGSPRGAAESLDAVADLLPAASSLLKEGLCV